MHLIWILKNHFEMSEKSFIFKFVKYLLIAKICIGIVFSFIVLFLFIVMTSHNSTDGKTTGVPAEDDLLYYHHNDSKSMDSKPEFNCLIFEQNFPPFLTLFLNKNINFLKSLKIMIKCINIWIIYSYFISVNNKKVKHIKWLIVLSVSLWLLLLFNCFIELYVWHRIMWATKTILFLSCYI